MSLADGGSIPPRIRPDFQVEELDTITRSLGVPLLCLRAEEVSACHRDRHFWTNLPAFSLCELLQQQQQPDYLLERGRMLCTARCGKAFCIVAHANAFNIVKDHHDKQGLCHTQPEPARTSWQVEAIHEELPLSVCNPLSSLKADKGPHAPGLATIKLCSDDLTPQLHPPR